MSVKEITNELMLIEGGSPHVLNELFVEWLGKTVRAQKCRVVVSSHGEEASGSFFDYNGGYISPSHFALAFCFI